MLPGFGGVSQAMVRVAEAEVRACLFRPEAGLPGQLQCGDEAVERPREVSRGEVGLTETGKGFCLTPEVAKLTSYVQGTLQFRRCEVMLALSEVD